MADAPDKRPQIFDFLVPETLDGERLDRALTHLAPQFSRARLKALIEDGRLAINGQEQRAPARKLHQGETLSLHVPATTPALPQGEAIALEIAFEDEHLLVIDKPAGLTVHPAPGNLTGTLVNAVIAHCGESLKGIGGVERPGIVHRLDKDTSGLMVVAKTEAAHRRLVEMFTARDIERRYSALVWGLPSPPQGEIEGAIGRDPKNRKKMAVVKRGGKPALTRYTLEAAYAGAKVARLSCRLASGRTHQIRVHLAGLGHPLLGDPLYGRSDAQRQKKLLGTQTILTRQALHAATLGFVHPVTGVTLAFESALPQDMKNLVHALESL